MGGKGQDAGNAVTNNSGYNNLTNAPATLSDPRMQDILSSYGSGKTSLADALSAAQGGQDYKALQAQAQKAYNDMWTKRNQMVVGPDGKTHSAMSTDDFNRANEAYQHTADAANKAEQDSRGGQDRMNAIFTNPLTGTKAATDQVMSNELYKPYIDYGKGLIGQNDKVTGNLDSDRNSLMGRDESYGLTDNDLKAYGQASDSIGRQYASSDQSLAQMLADRGLSQAPSGAAMQAFSGQLGNKNEQLAQMQQQIANSRIQTAKGLAEDRMNSDLAQQKTVQGSIQGMGNLAGQAVNDQFSRNMSGVQQYGQQNKDSLTAAQMAQQQQNEMFGQQQATKGASFGDIMGGLATGAAGAFTGGLGGALGTGIGKGIVGNGATNTGSNWYAGNEASPGFVGPRR
jgi:hypothetical protein